MSRIGEDMVEALEEIAADDRGEVRAESYKFSTDLKAFGRIMNRDAPEPDLEADRLDHDRP